MFQPLPREDPLLTTIALVRQPNREGNADVSRATTPYSLAFRAILISLTDARGNMVYICRPINGTFRLTDLTIAIINAPF